MTDCAARMSEWQRPARRIIGHLGDQHDIAQLYCFRYRSLAENNATLTQTQRQLETLPSIEAGPTALA